MHVAARKSDRRVGRRCTEHATGTFTARRTQFRGVTVMASKKGLQ